MPTASTAPSGVLGRGWSKKKTSLTTRSSAPISIAVRPENCLPDFSENQTSL